MCSLSDNIVKHLSRSQSTTDSLLSSSVRELFCESKSETSEDILTPGGFLDWEKIASILDELCYTRSTPCHKGVVKRLAPGLTHIYSVFRNMSAQEFWLKYGDYFNWTGNKKQFIHALDFLQSQRSVISSVLATLQLTAAVERALGNVYLLKGKTLPFLLKDLLSTAELEEILGKNEMALISIFMGTPASLNLRNILWHGFVSPSEIDERYGYFLVVFTMSLGFKLQNMCVRDIPFRSHLTFSKASVLQDTFPDVGEAEVLQLDYIFQNTYTIHDCSRPYWRGLLQMYREKRYGDAITILVPHLETCLRNIFAAINNCPHRTLTAEPDARYVTLTEMLGEFLDDGNPNAFSTILTESEMELLLDIFVHPEGPRVRDRLSHGEVDFFSIPQPLVKHVLCVAAVFCMKFMMNENQSKGDFIEQLQILSEIYQPFFHPVSLLKDKIVLFVQMLGNLDSCPIRIPEVIFVEDESCPDVFYDCVSSLCAFYELPTSFRLKWRSFSDELSGYEKFVSGLRVSTVFRPKIEAEVTVASRKICHHCVESCGNLGHALNTYHASWREKSLRSRRRTTYTTFLRNVFVICGGLRVLLVTLIGQTNSINTLALWSPEKRNTMFKILKHSQKYIENLDVMSTSKMNRWEESLRLTEHFVEGLFKKLKHFERQEVPS